ncbi:MAG: RNA methyltransferase [Oscillospiraceae bacterium]|nr:RNA methyltransferase [Oscillospiraceae bacterium]
MQIELQALGDSPWAEWLSCREPQLYHYYEPEPGLFIAESPNVIARALQAGYEPVSLLIDRKELGAQTEALIAQCGSIPVYLAENAVLNSIRGMNLTRGVLCAMRRKPLLFSHTVLQSMRRLALLENVMNPTNLGAVFRSAAALGIDAVLLTAGCTDPLYRRAARVSMGTVFQVPWYILPDAPEAAGTLQDLRKDGWQSAAMALRNDSVSIDAPQLRAAEKLVIVLGTEGEGLAPETIAACDYTVRIPMSHGVDSLNVAAASAVAFWALRASAAPEP